jgi:hypothetical protein
MQDRSYLGLYNSPTTPQAIGYLNGKPSLSSFIPQQHAIIQSDQISLD